MILFLLSTGSETCAERKLVDVKAGLVLGSASGPVNDSVQTTAENK